MITDLVRKHKGIVYMIWYISTLILKKNVFVVLNFPLFSNRDTP